MSKLNTETGHKTVRGRKFIKKQQQQKHSLSTEDKQIKVDSSHCVFNLVLEHFGLLQVFVCLFVFCCCYRVASFPSVYQPTDNVLFHVLFLHCNTKNQNIVKTNPHKLMHVGARTHTVSWIA